MTRVYMFVFIAVVRDKCVVGSGEWLSEWLLDLVDTDKVRDKAKKTFNALYRFLNSNSIFDTEIRNI